jgi:hypothetical protein
LAVEKADFRARLVIGGAGASPLLLKEASDKLAGKDVHDKHAVEETAKQARSHASAFMVDNLGSTLEYRKKMSAVMARRAVEGIGSMPGDSWRGGRLRGTSEKIPSRSMLTVKNTIFTFPLTGRSWRCCARNWN